MKTKTKTNFYSSKKKEARKLMMKLSKPIRNSKGEIIKHAQFQNPKAEVGKIHADRMWFKETRTIAKEEVDKLATKSKNLSPYEVLLSKNLLPFSLIENKPIKTKQKVNFQEIYSKQTKKIKPNFDKLLLNSSEKQNFDKVEKIKEENRESTHQKGISKRIWNELFKVIDCSDVVVHVLDSRDPLNTKCDLIEKYVAEKKKKLVYILNKVDLIPFNVSSKWQSLIGKKHPCLLFHANSLKNSYGKENLINLLKQFKKMSDKEISVGFVGYPNTGKSSIINALRSKDVCSVAPIPGETKCYQYISLTKQINLIDSPGVVPHISTDQAILKGAVRIENVKDSEFYVDLIYAQHKTTMENVYGIKSKNSEEFLELFAKKHGKLLKGGIVNIECGAKMILSDYIRGKIPYFNEPTEDFYKN